MSKTDHDAVVAYVAEHRFPFAGQRDWPADYVTLTNTQRRMRSVPLGEDEHFPDIVIMNTRGVVHEVGEVEMRLDPSRVPLWKAGSLAADDLTETGERHFFLYVPAGEEARAVALLDEHGISFAGVRGFSVGGDGVRIAPFVTRGDAKDHR